MTTPGDVSYTAEPQMCVTNSFDVKGGGGDEQLRDEQKQRSQQHGNWDCQSWSCLACCAGGNTANGGDCVNAINVCFAGILMGLGEMFNAFTGCCTSCCHCCGECCGNCCTGDCCT